MKRFSPNLVSLVHLTTLTICTLTPSSAIANPESGSIWTDTQGDAVIRRTDTNNDAPLPIGFVPIDLLSVSVEGWMPTSPTSDLYTGSVITGDANFVRIQVVVDGVVSPPGPIGLQGFPYDPYKFGERPIIGFIELDIDGQKNSGGELMPIARNRYLANVGRFGLSPEGSISERMAQSADDIDSNLSTFPQFERTGSEFTLNFCGCFSPTILAQNGNLNNLFESGETWTLGGRFFERFESFAPLSLLFGGSDFGLYNPITALRFEHSISTDNTTITLVFPITNAGAALQAGQPEQSIDLNISNHTSMEEAIDDLILSANFASGDLAQLVNDWKGEDTDDFREPRRWDVTALIGTAPLLPQPSSFYVWTDTGFCENYADFNLDELNTDLDNQTLQTFIDLNDGSSSDADSTINGEFAIQNFGQEFHFFDLNYDGILNNSDFPTPDCTADLTSDGMLDFFDISAFLSFYTVQDAQADFNNDGLYDFFDISVFLAEFSAGCP
ncbi:MAG: GC-type dockerin domain-anchored protein [Phycisphaerales bacterium]